MIAYRRLLAFRAFLLISAILVAVQGATAAEDSGNRWAVLIGVDDYARAEKLKYCGADMRALSDQLITSGFSKDNVYLLHDEAKETKFRPVKSNIEDHLKLVLGLVEPDDLVVVAFSGHGVHLDGKSYLCPTNTKLDDPKTMVSLDVVYEQLKKCPASLKLLLVDACRNDPRLSGQRSLKPTEGTKQFATSLEKPPQGILLLTSCAPGEISMEEKEFGHGVFMHFVLEGLQGKADANRDRGVSMMEMYLYANNKTKNYVARKFSGWQRPALKGEINDDFTLARLDVKPETVRPTPPVTEPSRPQTQPAPSGQKVITNSIGMKLKLIPAGEFMMGSPENEEGRDEEGQDNDELQHRVCITKPFYLGVYEVTQEQYERVMDKNPSKFKGKDRPVEKVTWGDAMEFCRRLSQKEGKTYSLPTEAQWEYACRAGTTTPFASGKMISSRTDANFNGDYTYGGSDKGPSRAETAPVGSYSANSWDLYDIHGNVCEWCSDQYYESYYKKSPLSDPKGPDLTWRTVERRVIRGGFWNSNPVYARSAARNRASKDFVSDGLGFRVSRTP